MRTRSAICLTVLAVALALGGPALAFDPPRHGFGATVGEIDPPRPPGAIPRARAVAPAAIPNPGPLAPMARPIPSSVAPALVVPAPPPLDTRLGPSDIPLDVPNATGYAPANTATGPAAVTPFEAFRSGAQMLRHGEKEKALRALEYAADRGLVMAQWKLGRMYAEGEGVEQSDLRAFEYFRRIADMHAEDPPGTPQARFIANAFVALGHYHITGIPNTYVTVDIPQARKMYYHAATYFGDGEAQYFYARTLLDGTGGNKDSRRAAQWFYSAANKGQARAQALLGRMLFKGEPGVQRQPARGLMWLQIAKSNATPADAWIVELCDAALRQANEDEKALAGELLLQWMNAQRN